MNQWVNDVSKYNLRSNDSLGSEKFWLSIMCEIWADIKYDLKQYFWDLASSIWSGLAAM